MKAEIETTTGVMLSVEEYNRLSASEKRVKELEAELKSLVDSVHFLRMTYANNSLHSNDMNKFLKEIGLMAAHDKARAALEAPHEP